MSKVILKVSGINYGWNRALRQGGRDLALGDVSFELSSGEIVALLGPNGSGKSTLMKLVSGIHPLPATPGKIQVQFLEQDFLALSTRKRAQSVVYLGADLRAEFPITAEEAVSLGYICQSDNSTQKSKRNSIQWAMELCLCWDLRKRRLDSLSGGERQLVALARALVQGGKVLFLDESLSRMDLNHQAVMCQMLKELTQKGWAILWVSHDLNLAAEWSNRAILLKEGRKIAEGLTREVVNENNLQKMYPGVNLQIVSNPTTGAPQVFFKSIQI